MVLLLKINEMAGMLLSEQQICFLLNNSEKEWES